MENSLITSLGPTWIGSKVFPGLRKDVVSKRLTSLCLPLFQFGLQHTALAMSWGQGSAPCVAILRSQVTPKIPGTKHGKNRGNATNCSDCSGFFWRRKRQGKSPTDCVHCGGLPKFTERRRVAFPSWRAWFTSPAGASDAGAFVFYGNGWCLQLNGRGSRLEGPRMLGCWVCITSIEINVIIISYILSYVLYRIIMCILHVSPTMMSG